MLCKYKLYKYKSYDESEKHRDDIITKQELYFFSVEKFNDPIDSNLVYRQQYSKDEIVAFWKNFLKNHPNHPQSLAEILQRYGENEAFVKFKSESAKRLKSMKGVLCLSKNPKNILMWSHYADSHKGLVYEFEFEVDTDPKKNGLNQNNLFWQKTDDFQPFPYKIDYPYDREYEPLSYTLTDDEIRQQFARLLTTKAPDWMYEQEYRFIDLHIKNDNDRAKKFNKKCLKSIIFGKEASEETIQRVKRLCKENGFDIAFKQADFIDGKFELEFKDI